MRHMWYKLVQTGRKGGASHAREERRGCDRPRPFSVIAIWAGIVLAKCRGRTVTSAQVSGGICIILVS